MNIICLLSLLAVQTANESGQTDQSPPIIGEALPQTPGDAYAPPSQLGILFTTYLKTLGWAIVGSVAMGFGLIIALTIFTFMTRKVDEWELIKQGNIPMGIIMAAVVIGTSIVVAVIARP